MNERIRQGDLSALEEVERLAHSIHGAGALFGFPDVSAAGGAIEHLIEGGMANAEAFSSTPESALLRRLFECTEQLAHQVEAAAHTEPSSAGMFQ
jgi:chemotaxis protein histidine kinase CheA